MQKALAHTLIIGFSHYDQYKMISRRFNKVIFYSALVSSVDVKDGTLTSRAVNLVHPLDGNNL